MIVKMLNTCHELMGNQVTKTDVTCTAGLSFSILNCFFASIHSGMVTGGAINAWFSQSSCMVAKTHFYDCSAEYGGGMALKGVFTLSTTRVCYDQCLASQFGQATYLEGFPRSTESMQLVSAYRCSTVEGFHSVFRGDKVNFDGRFCNASYNTVRYTCAFFYAGDYFNMEMCSLCSNNMSIILEIRNYTRGYVRDTTIANNTGKENLYGLLDNMYSSGLMFYNLVITKNHFFRLITDYHSNIYNCYFYDNHFRYTEDPILSELPFEPTTYVYQHLHTASCQALKVESVYFTSQAITNVIKSVYHLIHVLFLTQ